MTNRAFSDCGKRRGEVSADRFTLVDVPVNLKSLNHGGFRRAHNQLVRLGNSVPASQFYRQDYSRDGDDRQQVMTLGPDEFIRRFMLHVLPRGFHRIRHYGLLAGSSRRASLAGARELQNVAAPPDDDTPDEPDAFRPLRRTHDRHRDVLKVEAAPRTATQVNDELG